MNYSELSSRLIKKLRDLDYANFQFILVANAIAGDTRKGGDFAWLREVQWRAVVDFDASSENNGLHVLFANAKEEDTTSHMERQLQVIDVSNLGRDHISSANLFSKSSNQLPWVFANGRSDVSAVYHSYSDWVGSYADPAKECLKRFIRTCVCPISVFVAFTSSSLKEMASLVQCAYSISRKRNIVILADGPVCKQLTELSQVDVRDCCVAGLPWEHVNVNIKDLLPQIAGNPAKFSTVVHWNRNTGSLIVIE